MEEKQSEGIWADTARSMVARYASSSRGHGGYPLANERYAISRALDERRDLLATMRKMAEGWANAIELRLIPPQHVTSATILRDEAFDAIAKATGDA